MTLYQKIIAANKASINFFKGRESFLAVDFDKSLVKTDGLGDSEMNPGEPIKPVVNLVKRVLKKGIKVKIFTARVDFAPHSLKVVEKWCKDNLGQKLPITNVKTANMFMLIDDKAYNVTKEGDILH